MTDTNINTNPQTKQGNMSSISSNAGPSQQHTGRRIMPMRKSRFVENLNITAPAMEEINPFVDPEDDDNDPFPEPLDEALLFSATTDYDRASPTSPPPRSWTSSPERPTSTGLSHLQGPTATLRSAWSSSSNSSSGSDYGDENPDSPDPASPTSPAEPALRPSPSPLSPLTEATWQYIFNATSPAAAAEPPGRPLSPLDPTTLASIFLQPADESDMEYLRATLSAAAAARARQAPRTGEVEREQVRAGLRAVARDRQPLAGEVEREYPVIGGGTMTRRVRPREAFNRPRQARQGKATGGGGRE